MTDIRKQILLELLYVLEKQNSSKNKNFVLRELFPDDLAASDSSGEIPPVSIPDLEIGRAHV